MQARITREGEITVIHLSGRVDVETAEPFREACLKHLIGHKVVFDFRSLSFVGSSGILPFLQTMQEFAQKSALPFKFSGVGSEFKKVFAATALGAVEIHETAQQAVEALLRPRVTAPEAVIAHSPAAAAVAPAPVLRSAATEIGDGGDVGEDQEDEKADYGLLSLTPAPAEDPERSDEEL